MNKKQPHQLWLLIDATFLCHRAFYSFKDLRHEDVATGVIFGFFRDIISFQELFETNHIAFFWDHGYNKRRKEMPEYKIGRREFKLREKMKMSDEEKQQKKEFKTHIRKLKKYLSSIGFKNNFMQEGYEGDDLIASACKSILANNEAIIITADADMFQCIRHNIHFYNPNKKKTITLQSFKKKYGIMPQRWNRVKAIAGCNSDSVKGIMGVGEKTAIQYLNLTLKCSSKKYVSIISYVGQLLIAKNLPIVSLPYEGTQEITLQTDNIKEKDWKKLVEKFNMKSLKDVKPFSKKDRHKKAEKKSQKGFF